MFKCDFFLDKCRSSCCGVFPFDNNWFNKYKHMAVNNYILHKFGNLVVAVTKDYHCVFLSAGKCNVYEARPEVCKMFGLSSEQGLDCPYQDCNGKTRTRNERRNIERNISKQIKKKLKVIEKHCKIEE